MSGDQSAKEAFLLSVLRKIEGLKEGVICIAHEDYYPDGSLRWYWIAVNDYAFYAQDKRFKTFSKAYHKAAAANGLNIQFCYCSMSESYLLKLANENNLIMDY